MSKKYTDIQPLDKTISVYTNEIDKVSLVINHDQLDDMFNYYVIKIATTELTDETKKNKLEKKNTGKK
jgi:hypothetical protein